jgi:hypothetical protein
VIMDGGLPEGLPATRSTSAGVRFGLWKRPLLFESCCTTELAGQAGFEPVFESRPRFR